MELYENSIYTTDEMIEFLGVSKDTWKKKKEQLLFHFGSFYEYEVIYDPKDHRKRNYKILKQLYEYEPPQKKSIKRDKIYESQIKDVVEYDSIQTAKNVSRIIKDTDEIKELNHKDGTVYEYTRVRLRIMFGTKAGESGTCGTITEKIWCRLDKENNCYETLSDQEIEAFYKLFKEEKEAAKEEQLTLYCDYENGLITREELNEQIGESGLSCYLSARNTFNAKYGFYPIKVPVYELSAFEAEEEEKIAA